MKFKVKLKIKPVDQIIKRLGLDESGDVQAFHTQNVLRRIVKYMPKREGNLIRLTQIQTDIRKPEIITEAPQAKYLFQGEKMIDPKINAAGFLTPEGWRSRANSVKVRTGQPLKYFKGKNKNAGPHWDKALSAAEGEAMAADLQRYIDRKAGKK